MMMHAFSLFLATSILGLCGASLPPAHQDKQKEGETSKPAIPLNEQEAIIKDVLQSWDRQYNEFESYSFDAEITEKDPTFKREIKGAAKILMLKRPNGNIWVKMDVFDEKGKATFTYILRDRQLIILDSAAKQLFLRPMDKPWNKESLGFISDAIFAALPFIQTDEVALRKQYRTSVVQKDEDYTWIKLVPIKGSGWFQVSAGLIGIINYRNNFSPKHFPIMVIWREPGGKEITWKFTKVTINHPFTVVESDFYLDYSQLKQKGWHASPVSMKSTVDFLKKYFKISPLQFSL